MITAFVLGGLLLWYNGAMDETAEVLQVQVAKKFVTQKPAHYYAYVQSWHDANRLLQLPVDPGVYEGTKPGASLYLTIGKGAANIEWIRAIALREPVR